VVAPLPHDPGPHWGEVGIHGLHRQREWDAVASVSELPIDGDEAWLVVLADWRVVTEYGHTADAPGLAATLRLAPPYRARAVRRPGHWMVAGRRIETVELPHLGAADELELAWDGAERTVRIDDMPTVAGVPLLERLAGARFPTYVVTARRIVETTWEVEVSPL